MFCDIHTPDGQPYTADSRYCLKRVLRKCAEKGYTYYCGPELEFFLFNNDRSTDPLDQGGYFDAPPLDLGNNIRRDIIFALEKMGIAIEYSHHEAAASQHEIDMRYAEALKMADITMRSLISKMPRPSMRILRPKTQPLSKRSRETATVPGRTRRMMPSEQTRPSCSTREEVVST